MKEDGRWARPAPCARAWQPARGCVGWKTGVGPAGVLDARGHACIRAHTGCAYTHTRTLPSGWRPLLRRNIPVCGSHGCRLLRGQTACKRVTQNQPLGPPGTPPIWEKTPGILGTQMLWCSEHIRSLNGPSWSLQTHPRGGSHRKGPSKQSSPAI